MVPGLPEHTQEFKVTIGARSLRDLLDHFPIARGPKSYPQIIWTFSDEEVILKALESSLDTSGKPYHHTPSLALTSHGSEGPALD